MTTAKDAQGSPGCIDSMLGEFDACFSRSSLMVLTLCAAVGLVWRLRRRRGPRGTMRQQEGE
jgi:hypothetical protein